MKKVRPAKADKDAKLREASPAGLHDIMRNSSCLDVVFLIGGAILSLMTGAMLPMQSLVFKGITDVLMSGEANHTLGSLDIDVFSSGVLYYCSLYLYLGIGVLAVSYAANACLYTLCERRLHYIRKQYLRAVMRQDMTWLDAQSTGALTQKMSSGIERIKDGVGDKMGILLNAVGTFIAGISFGFYMCWQLTLVMLISVPLMLISMYVSGKMLSRAAKCEMAAFSEAASLAQEVIDGIRTVIAFNAQPYETNRYESCLLRARSLGIRKAFVLATFAAVPVTLMFVTMAGAFWFGSTLVANGIVSPGTIFGVFWSVLLGTIRLGAAAPNLGVLLGARLAARDIFSVIDRVPDINCERHEGHCPKEMKGHLEMRNLEFSYPTRPTVKILKGVSFEVQSGQSIALVGPSGCGKSTILSFLQRFYEQDAGTICLDEIPLRDYNIQWLRSMIGVVQQEPVVFVATVTENIRMGDVLISDENVEEACKLANAHDFIMKLPEGYSTVIGEGSVQLSGGQRQRISIARVLARKPRILLLDEATSALDTESERAVQAALDKAKEGRTTIMVAHRLSTVRNCDRIFVFEAGRIVEQGNHETLMEIEDGLYVAMVRSQELAKAEEDTTLDDVDPTEIRRSFPRDTASGDGDAASRQEIARLSARIRMSMISTTSQEVDWQIESAREEMIEEGAMEASLLDIFKYSKEELPMAAVGFLLSIIRGLTWPMFSIIYGKLFMILSVTPADELTSSSMVTSLWFLLLAVLSGISTFGSGSLFGITGEKMAMRLRMDVYKNILRQDASYFDDAKHSTAVLTSRLATDAPNVQAAIDQRLSEVLQGLSSLVAGVIVAFSFGWNMAPIGLATALLLVIAQSSVAQYLKFRGHKDLEIAVEASRLVTESVSNVRCVQSMNRQGFMFEAYCAAAEEPHRRAIARGLWQSLSFGLSNAFMFINFAIAYAFGLWLIRNGWSSPFVVFQVIEALNMASVSVLAAASYFPEYIRARISAGVLFTMTRQKPRIDNTSHVGETPEIVGNLSLRNVYFSYPTRRRCLILDGININAKFGQTVALVGPSGCGKSTVIQLLERFYDPLCGAVMVDNHDIRDVSVRHLRDEIALVGQEPVLFNVSIRDNIAYGLDDCSTEEIEKAARLANIHQFVSSLPEGYSTLAGSRGGSLSGGQKQRIAVARAMVRNPKILLLDEATSALDSESEKVVQEALDRARLGRTCIVVAHRLSTIQNADVIVVCRDGKVVEQGSHQTLLARKGLYFRLVETHK